MNALQTMPLFILAYWAGYEVYSHIRLKRYSDDPRAQAEFAAEMVRSGKMNAEEAASMIASADHGFFDFIAREQRKSNIRFMLFGLSMVVLLFATVATA